MPAFVAALDIGTTKTCALIAEVTNRGSIRILGAGVTPSRGMRKGVVTDVKETSQAIVMAVEQAERISGIKVEAAYVGIAGAHIQSTNSRGVAAIHSGRGVTADDMARAMEAAEAIAVPNNREIIHAIPRGYTLDGQDGVQDPLGMVGFRLEVEAHIVTGATASIQNLVKSVEAAGIKVLDLVLEPLARVVDHHIGTEPFHERLAARRCRRRDMGAQLLGYLDREGADSSGAARDEHALAGAQVQLVAQRLQRGEPGERYPRR